MTLLIAMDGVSVRWCCLADDASTAHAVIEQVSVEAWSQALPTDAPTRVVACAQSDVWASEFSAFCRDRWQIEAQWPEAPDTEMSMARWAALAYVRVQSGVHVVVHADEFTSMDALGVDGVHHVLGRLPGMALMQSALYQQTKGIQSSAVREAAVLGDVFALNTAGGVQAGAQCLSIAWIDRVVSQFEAKLGTTVTVWITGAQAGVLSPLTHPATRCDELVLNGLKRLVDSGL
jgi:Type III pantothenate kinase